MWNRYRFRTPFNGVCSIILCFFVASFRISFLWCWCPSAERVRYAYALQNVLLLNQNDCSQKPLNAIKIHADGTYFVPYNIMFRYFLLAIFDNGTQTRQWKRRKEKKKNYRHLIRLQHFRMLSHHDKDQSINSNNRIPRHWCARPLAPIAWYFMYAIYYISCAVCFRRYFLSLRQHNARCFAFYGRVISITSESDKVLFLCRFWITIRLNFYKSWSEKINIMWTSSLRI